MSGKTIKPEQLTQAVALRAAGLSLVGIAERVGVSVSTLQRVFRKHPISKGEAQGELVAAARHELLQRVTSDDAIKEEAARLIADDISHSRMLRERIAVAAEHLTAHNLPDAALLMRAAAAYSVALKNTSDVLRRVMRLDKAFPEPPESLPELVVRVISPDDAARMTQQASLGSAHYADNVDLDECEAAEPDDDHDLVVTAS